MLLVATKVAPSQIEGLGLFANEWIRAGTVVSKWNESFAVRMTDEQFLALPAVPRAFVERHGWRAIDGLWRISLDDSRFLNHSNTPNLVVTVSSNCAYEARALKDIPDGHELTENYRQFDPDFDSYGAAWL